MSNQSGTTGGAGAPKGALLSVAFALVVAVVAWRLLGTATDKGLDRLARIDRLRDLCTGFYAQARNRSDTMRVDRAPLPDTVDAGSKDAFDRCGDLRRNDVPTTLPNPREMSGTPMPSGLR